MTDQSFNRMCKSEKRKMGLGSDPAGVDVPDRIAVEPFPVRRKVGLAAGLDLCGGDSARHDPQPDHYGRKESGPGQGKIPIDLGW